MQKPIRRISIEAEKKKNVTIAIVTAASGVILGIVLYIGMFVVMFAFPLAFFSFMPIPADHKDMVSVDGRLLLFTRELDFGDASHRKEPDERFFMREFDGKNFSNPVPIEPFHSVYASGGRIYFFKKGYYRVYDFQDWKDFENAAIGDSPKGAVSPDGVWVLSNLMGKPALVLINEGLAVDVPLPLERGEGESLRICSSRIMWSGGELHLFWNINGTLVHERYDGNEWHSGGYFEKPGQFDVMEYKGKLLLFTREMGKAFEIWTFDNGGWSSSPGPDMGEGDFSIGFNVAELEGKRAILLNNIFFSSKLYLLEDGNIARNYSIGSPFKNSLISWVAYLNVVLYGITFLFIFAVSAIMNKYKLTYLPLKHGRVRFASIFRRFLAHLIDTFVVMIPFGIFGYMIFRKGFPPDNPFRLIGMIGMAVVGMVLFKYLYSSLFEGLLGRTPGKWICGIMVLKDNFTRCTLGRAFLRNLLRIVDAMFYYFVALISISATLKWQRLGDLAAGTVVVRYRRRKKV